MSINRRQVKKIMVHVHYEFLWSNSKEQVSMDSYFWIHNHLLAELYLTSLPITKSKQLGKLIIRVEGSGGPSNWIDPQGESWELLLCDKSKAGKEYNCFRMCPLCQQERPCGQALFIMDSLWGGLDWRFERRLLCHYLPFGTLKFLTTCIFYSYFFLK